MSINLKKLKPLALNLALTPIFLQLAGCHFGGAGSSGNSPTPSNSSGGAVTFTVSATTLGPNEETLTVTNTSSNPITAISKSISGLSTLSISAGSINSCTAVSELDPVTANGGTCTYTAQSANNTAPGTTTGTTTITGSDLDGAPYDIILNGTINGYLYAGSSSTNPNGVLRSNGSSWSLVGTTSPGTIFDMIADSLGNIYLVDGVSNGVFEWDNANTWNSIGGGTTPNPAPTALGFDSIGNLYVGTTGFFELVNGAANWTTISNTTPSVNPGAIAFDSSNNVYLGAGDGVYEWTAANPSPSLSLLASSPTTVNHLAFNGSTLYAASDNGVYTFSGGIWTKISGSPTNAKTLTFANNGDLYVGFAVASTGADIQKYNGGGSWSNVGTSTPTNVYSLIFDANNNLYAGTSNASNDVFKLASPYTGAWTQVNTGSPSDVFSLVLASTLSITN